MGSIPGIDSSMGIGSVFIMCVFCDKIKCGDYFYENDKVVALYDAYPVSKGHCLIVPKRHFDSYFYATEGEIRAIYKAIKVVRKITDERYQPDGYNIGVNIGEVAGQSVQHMHVHIIPRYVNDMQDPKGGVRGVIPNKQKY
ncbi:MAG: HIT family protein [Bacilli bacterium]|nr:HIT family protein [Bacilli bacterium]